MSEITPPDRPYKPVDNTGIPLNFWAKLFLNRHPKYWLLGFVLVLCRLLALLPYSLLLFVGSLFGRLCGLLSVRLRHIVRSNIALCYPQLPQGARAALGRACFKELGITLAETLNAWFSNPAKFWRRVELEGDENWQRALASDRGIIMLSCHYGSLDLNAALAGFLARRDRVFAFTYRQPSDAIVDQFLHAARRDYGDHFYSVRNLVGITRTLKKKGVVWYAPDIEVKNKNTVFADFMGVPASTTIAVSRLAAATGAVVVPFGHYRNSYNKRYTLKIYSPLENFPSDDPLADTRRMNKAIERIIEPYPERYWWVIKRFKHRPQGARRVY